MPIITITQADLDKNKPMEAGWALLTVSNVKAEASKDKQSINYIVELANDKGQEIQQWFNSKALGMMENFLKAVLDTDELPRDGAGNIVIDTDKLIGAKVYNDVKNEIYKKNDFDTGRIVARAGDFSPASRPPF